MAVVQGGVLAWKCVALDSAVLAKRSCAEALPYYDAEPHLETMTFGQASSRSVVFSGNRALVNALS
jgi:hypothetical protein